MEFNSSTISDDHLAHLLSLGFDIELCRQALRANSTLEDATEWILNPNRQSTLKLDLTKPIASSSALSPFAKPMMTEEEKRRENEDSRLLQKKKFERIAHNLSQEKKSEREARRKALLDIENDKQRRRKAKTNLDIGVQHNNFADNNNQSSFEATKAATRTTNLNSSEQKFTYIQFKLTNSAVVREKFLLGATVKDALTFILDKEKEILAQQQSSSASAIAPFELSIENISLDSVFPRKTFTNKDGSLDMHEAGFFPNVSLNVKLIQLPTENDMDTVMQYEESNAISEDENSLEEFNTIEQDGDGDTMDAFSEDDLFDFNHLHNTIPHLQPFLQERGHRLTDPLSSNDNNNMTIDDSIAEESVTDRRSNFLTAFENRRTSSAADDNKLEQKVLTRHTKTLKEICSTSVAGYLSQHSLNANNYLKDLMNISSELAETLLNYLMKNGKLNTATLNKLTKNCYLQNVRLDSYQYCTDSLIDDLAKSNSSISITKLSLRGCDIITDNGFRSLTGLKNLCYLDLNNCKLTDKGLKSLENLCNIIYLNLSKTKITCQGVSSMAVNAKFKNQLEVLLLDGCDRLNTKSPAKNIILVHILNEFTNLSQLSLAYTYVHNQQLEELQLRRDIKIRLQQLDLSHTLLTDEDMIHIVSQLQTLTELKLGGCELLTTRGLSFLPKELTLLRYIQFPNREHELDGVLSRLKDLPLEHLDLSGFLNITDEGVQYIACMKQLRYLSLDGTKITDEGVALLKDLIELESLYLDRTSVTNMGILKLKELTKLHTLSLCHTTITNALLKLLGNFEQTSFTRCLRILNLAQCGSITDKGVRGLTGMVNLTYLNLDHTNVSKSCLKYLKDLKYLKPVRLQGIEKEEEEEESEDDDEILA
ncbi:MAG: hypothetical protein EXX96DRAFT_628159 [Benjaminiella poitrasii]|nr:MAG: hypothetical protein EXX96DRAFT_628159 [Benjaminiella poitrasii]